MAQSNKTKIFLVDDDAVFLKLLQIDFLHHGDFEIETYATGELCVASLANMPTDIMPDLVILDYHLDGIDKTAMNGMATLDKIKAISDIPVVMLSSQDKIEVAIDCMHHKATDYVVKSETSFMRLQKIISNLFEIKKIKKQLAWYMDRV